MNPNNTDSLDKLLTKSYSISEMQDFVRQGSPLDGFVWKLDEIHQKFPIECFRQVSETEFYIVYRIQEGGYLFAFLTGNTAGQSYLSHSYYAKVPLDGRAFANLRKGDKTSAVEIIDPVLRDAAANQKASFYNYLMTDHGEGTVHYTSEGLYVITYTEEEAWANKHIKSLSRFSDFRAMLSEDKFSSYRLLDLDLTAVF